jgi:hypothetical protein
MVSSLGMPQGFGFALILWGLALARRNYVKLDGLRRYEFENR